MTKNPFRTLSVSVLWAMLVLAGCSSLPSDFPRQASYAIPPDPNTELAQSLHSDADGVKDRARFLLLNDGAAALRSRLALVDMAQRPLDMQYFIWHGDASGALLLDGVFSPSGPGLWRVNFDENKTCYQDETCSLRVCALPVLISG